MVQLDAGIIGPDGLGGAYKNTADVREAAWWHALGGQQGIIKGMAITGVPGSMAVSVAAGAVLVSRRDGSNNLQDMGYLIPVPTATTVTFGPASASARNDALVAAVVDTTDGAVGTGALASGGHLVVVPGVSGTATTRTDAQIAAYLGRGGFGRLMDVPIASTDTQINMANVVMSTTAGSPYLDRYLLANTNHTSSGSFVTVNLTGTTTSRGGMAYTSSACVVPTAGLYLVSVKVAFDVNGTGQRWVQIQKNGSGVKKFGPFPHSDGSTTAAAMGSALVLCAAADTISVGAYQNSGGTLAMLAGVDTSFMQVARLGL